MGAGDAVTHMWDQSTITAHPGRRAAEVYGATSLRLCVLSTIVACSAFVVDIAVAHVPRTTHSGASLQLQPATDLDGDLGRDRAQQRGRHVNQHLPHFIQVAAADPLQELFKQQNSPSPEPCASDAAPTSGTRRAVPAQPSLRNPPGQVEYCAGASGDADVDTCADDYAKYRKLLTTGRAIQLYTKGVQLQGDRPAFALALFQAVIDRFPDDKFAERAVDKIDNITTSERLQREKAQRDSTREADQIRQHNLEIEHRNTELLEQQQTEQQRQQEQLAQNEKQLARNRCEADCANTFNSCQTDAQNMGDAGRAVSQLNKLGPLGGLISNAAENSSESDCSSNLNSCRVDCAAQ
jgi:hypothetical protein